MIAIVHLVRAANGIEPFAAFIRSYQACHAGEEHRLVVVFKGFPAGAVPQNYASLCGGGAFDALFVEDRGFDLATYFRVAVEISSDSFCFLNSYSEILAPGWLALMHRHLSQPGVGLVGASGNLISWYTNLVTDWEQLKIGAVYRGPTARMRLRLRRALYRAIFPPFPNPHLRTNAFLISRDLFLSLGYRPRLGKLDTYRFESGRTGMTRQIQARGLGVRVVGKDGRGYGPGEWAQSGTFWQESQENLLVADNQTRRFTKADEATRRRLTRIAWGDSARV